MESIYNEKTGLSRDGVDLAIHHLQCTKRAALTTYTSLDGQQITLIKIASPNKQVSTISELERNRYDLNMSVDKKTKDVEDLEAKIQETDKQLRQLIREKKTNLAKIKLRQKKALEAQLGNLMFNQKNMFRLLKLKIPYRKNRIDSNESHFDGFID